MVDDKTRSCVTRVVRTHRKRRLPRVSRYSQLALVSASRLELSQWDSLYILIRRKRTRKSTLSQRVVKPPKLKRISSISTGSSKSRQVISLDLSCQPQFRSRFTRFTRGDENLSQEYEWFDLLERLHTWAPGYYCMIGNLVH